MMDIELEPGSGPFFCLLGLSIAGTAVDIMVLALS